jgi:ACS family hexuronate transporter-like MFS transporter
MLFGVLVTQIGYSPLFVVLAVFDLIAAAVVCLLAKSGDKAPEPRWSGAGDVVPAK